MDEKFVKDLNGSALAYMGDASIEIRVRKFLLSLGLRKSGVLNRLALRFVRATAQSAAMDNIMPMLTEEEENIFKRGRNANGISIPKSASGSEYRRATGMEALFGYLDLMGRCDRADELFEAAYGHMLQRLRSGDFED